MCVYKAMTICIVLILSTFLICPAEGAIYKWNDNEYRDAVEFIDMGHLKDGAYDLEFYTLVCVDGVKVYTVSGGSRNGGVYSIIIPGPCSGPAKPKPAIPPTYNYPEPKPKPAPRAPLKPGGVTW